MTRDDEVRSKENVPRLYSLYFLNCLTHYTRTTKRSTLTESTDVQPFLSEFGLDVILYFLCSDMKSHTLVHIKVFLLLLL